MKPSTFDAMAKELFGTSLGPHGFTSERSKTSVFYREASPGCYHIVLPDLGSRGVWYDVKVFPFATVLDPLFEKHFPDSLGIPTDTFCYLSERGVGPDQTQFNCQTEENFRRRFQSSVAALLSSVAIPFLTQLSTVNDMLPYIRNPLHRAIATHYVFGSVAARDLLKTEQQRLRSLDSSDERVVATRTLIDSLLRAKD